MEPHDTVDGLTRFRARVTRGVAAGLAATHVAFVVVFALTGALTAVTTTLLVVSAAFHAAAVAAPWARWLSGRWSRAAVLGYLGLTLLTIVMGVAQATTVDTDAFWGVLFVIAVGALVLPWSHLAVFVVAGFVGYVVAGAAGPGITVETTAARAVTLLLATGLLRVLVARWDAALAEAQAASRRYRRSAEVIATVADASSQVVELSPDEILTRVVEGMHATGFDMAGVWFLEDGRGAAPRAATADLHRAAHDTVLEEVIDEVVRTGTDMVLDQGVVATPVHRTDRLVGVLLGGLHDSGRPDEDLVRAARLFAVTAGRALELADRYEAEQRTVAELRELDVLKDDFISTVSHELRTPLAVLVGALDLLVSEDDEVDDALRTDLLRRAHRNVHDLTRAVQTLLDFRSLERRTLVARPAPVALDRLVEREVERVRGSAPGHDVELELQPVAVQADGSLLGRAIGNLIDNAVQHTPAGTPVRVTVSEDAGVARVVVRDDGHGIHPDDLPRLGQRFFRGGATNTRSTRGVGLGLALAREVLRLHGTALEIRSAPGEGATFTFTLRVRDRAVTTEGRAG